MLFVLAARFLRCMELYERVFVLYLHTAFHNNRLTFSNSFSLFKAITYMGFVNSNCYKVIKMLTTRVTWFVSDAYLGFINDQLFDSWIIINLQMVIWTRYRKKFVVIIKIYLKCILVLSRIYTFFVYILKRMPNKKFSVRFSLFVFLMKLVRSM